MSKSDFHQVTPSFSHRICETLNLTDDIYRRCGYIEMVSNTCALVDGCKSVMEYDDGKIKLNLGKNSVSFNGTGLTIRSLSMEQAMVEGFILSVEFSN